MSCRVLESPIAHSTLTDLSTVNVRSKPATACRGARPPTLAYVGNGRPSGSPVTGSRPAYSAANACSVTTDRAVMPAPLLSPANPVPSHRPGGYPVAA
jgi:hypothetical protein